MTTDAFVPWNYQLPIEDVHVKWATPGQVSAVVRGDSGIYDVHLHGGRWYCTCRSRTTCAHLAAVRTVTTPLAVTS